MEFGQIAFKSPLIYIKIHLHNISPPFSVIEVVCSVIQVPVLLLQLLAGEATLGLDRCECRLGILSQNGLYWTWQWQLVLIM